MFYTFDFDWGIAYLLEVFYYLDAEISFICGVDYGEYPFHSEICTLQMTSTTKNNESIVFKVGKN